MILRRKGFALYTAVMIGMLIAGVLAALTMGLATDLRRTRRLRNEAQMTQLMLAGMRITEAKLAAGSLHSGDSIDLPVPPELDDAGIHVQAAVVTSATADVTVTTKLAGKTREQHLTVEPTSGHWRTVSAELSP